ncbi:MAG: amidohydrolase family protein [Gemmatimonadota bacterium]|nr:amidohydrolase family protein [Gemmatimonadota bacterium]
MKQLVVSICLAVGACPHPPGQSSPYEPAPLADHHQHLFSPAMAALMSSAPPAAPAKPITANDLIPLLDAAGIKRAVILSTAYIFSQPRRKVENDYAKVKADNDWTSEQVALFPDRLVGFCSVNPVRDYALEELARCAKNPHFHGLKLHFGNSVVDYHNAQHIEQVRRVFSAANGYRMPIVVHMRATISERLPYGRDEALIFLKEILPAAPDVPVQIAHLAGAGGYDDPLVDQALAVFVEAIAKGDPRTKRLWFDVATVATSAAPPEQLALIASRIRQLGVQRILYGSDAATPGNTPREGWATFRKLPLTAAEFRTIANNVPPYMR